MRFVIFMLVEAKSCFNSSCLGLITNYSLNKYLRIGVIERGVISLSYIEKTICFVSMDGA